jgi:hypothetical protein
MDVGPVEVPPMPEELQETMGNVSRLTLTQWWARFGCLYTRFNKQLLRERLEMEAEQRRKEAPTTPPYEPLSSEEGGDEASPEDTVSRDEKREQLRKLARDLLKGGNADVAALMSELENLESVAKAQARIAQMADPVDRQNARDTLWKRLCLRKGRKYLYGPPDHQIQHAHKLFRAACVDYLLPPGGTGKMGLGETM